MGRTKGWTTTMGRAGGFTLVELLVVIGIIAALIGMLMPALATARRASLSLVCKSNLRTCGQFLLMYANDNNGYVFPMISYDRDNPKGWGTNVPYEQRWPVYVFGQLQPPCLSCPEDPVELLGMEDLDPRDKHSYVLNSHVVYQGIRYHRKGAQRSYEEIVVMGEKVLIYRDYYMEVDDYGSPNAVSDYDRLVELHRHGLNHGSNLLFLDGHVSNETPAKIGIDPWDPGVNSPATQPVID